MFDFIKRSGTLLMVSGVVAIIFGLIAIFSPSSTVVALVVLWGVYALVDGVLSLVAAFQPGVGSARWWMVALGILGVLAGILVIFRPFDGATAMAWILGFWLIVRGVVGLISAFGPVTLGSRLLLGLSAVLFIIAGILFLVNPGSAALGVAVLLGVLALGWGIFQLVSGLSIRRDAKKAL